MSTRREKDFAGSVVDQTRAVLEPLRDVTRAAPMQAYMKNVAPFLGIGTPERRSAMRPLIKSWGAHTSDELGAAARALWSLDEREYAYAACDLLAARNRDVTAEFLTAHGQYLITTKSWWDTVDSLGSAFVTPLVFANPDLVPLMWQWLRGDNIWLARAALQHQRGLKQNTDVQRLVAMCDERSTDKEFFIAKAVGWALRDLVVIDRGAAQKFLDDHPNLPGVAKRELLRGLNR